MKTYQLVTCTREACSSPGQYQPGPVSAQGKGYAARTDFPQAAGVAQCKRYTISRDLPMETHYSLIEDIPATKKNEKSPQEKAQDTLLSSLREAYPLSEENEQKAKEGNWSGMQRDSLRGEVFNQKKSELLSSLENRKKFLSETDEMEESYPLKAEERTKTGYWVSGAHVKGLSVVNERERKNTPESGLIKRVTKIDDWIGAHLIKREWGGEDNMWNVVCWPKSAEDAWGKGFEEPIDMAFTNRTTKKLDISVEVEKEDKTFSDDQLVEIVESKTKNKKVSPEWRNLIEQNAELAQMEANRALEGVPVHAKGTSTLGTSELSASDTKWELAKTKALEKINTVVETTAKKEPHKKQIENFKKSAVSDKQKEYGEEREKAMHQERGNYRSEIYDLQHNI